MSFTIYLMDMIWYDMLMIAHNLLTICSQPIFINWLISKSSKKAHNIQSNISVQKGLLDLNLYLVFVKLVLQLPFPSEWMAHISQGCFLLYRPHDDMNTWWHLPNKVASYNCKVLHLGWPSRLSCLDQKNIWFKPVLASDLLWTCKGWLWSVRSKHQISTIL